MKYLPIETNLFIQNRQRFAEKLKPNSIAILNANDIMPTSADGTRSFIQNTDIFYLSGIDQEESILVIFPDVTEKKHREVLFIRETNEEIANVTRRQFGVHFPDCHRLAGLHAIVVNGLEPRSNREILAMGQQHTIVWPALGIYPIDAICNQLPEDIRREVTPKNIIRRKGDRVDWHSNIEITHRLTADVFQAAPFPVPQVLVATVK